MMYNLVNTMSADFRLAVQTTHMLCEAVNTPRSLAVSLLLQYEEWGQYVDLPLDPDAYEDPRHFALDYLVTEILRKSPDLPLGVDRYQVALDSFWESEAQCKDTNIRIRTGFWEWRFAFQRMVLNILGPLSGSDLNFVEDHLKFGPGVTTGVRGRGMVVSSKYEETLHMTADLIPFVKSLLGENWYSLTSHRHVVVEGNEFTTVPKSAKTDRGICIEPTLNIYLQLGIGALIRKKLSRFGLDLNTQDGNRKLAEIAYSEELCTIDLSRASDSVCKELVLSCFPERWVHLLSIPRSGYTAVDSQLVELEKWSSMGNGYTFELESLIFYALCLSIVPKAEWHYVSVYGDDLILPRRYASSLIEALNFLGFSVNQSKSYLAGNFFESCGHDYFKGFNVRPFYLKSEKNIPFSLQAANKLRLYARRLNAGLSCDQAFRPTWAFLVRNIPRTWRACRVPESFGDVGVISSREEIPYVRPRDGWEGQVVRHITLTPRHKRKRTFGVLLAALARLRGLHPIEFNNDSDDVAAALFTRGREPARGLFGKPRSRKSVCYIADCGLSWSPSIFRSK